MTEIPSLYTWRRREKKGEEREKEGEGGKER